MGEAERHDKLLALLGGAVADAVDLKLFFEFLGHAVNHVRNERPGKPVQAFFHFLIVRTGDKDLAVFKFDADLRTEGLRQRAFGSFDRNRAAVDLDVDARGHGDGFSADSAHLPYPLTR